MSDSGDQGTGTFYVMVSSISIPSVKQSFMSSSFLCGLISLRGPLVLVNSIIKALFNHTVLLPNVLGQGWLPRVRLHYFSILDWCPRELRVTSRLFIMGSVSLPLLIQIPPCPFRRDSAQRSSPLHGLRGPVLFSLKMSMGGDWLRALSFLMQNLGWGRDKRARRFAVHLGTHREGPQWLASSLVWPPTSWMESENRPVGGKKFLMCWMHRIPVMPLALRTKPKLKIIRS